MYVEERMILGPAGAGQDHFVFMPGDYRQLTLQRASHMRVAGLLGDDVCHAKRQQQVILAIRDKVLLKRN